ncbi:MAG: competence damage-inducible protein A [Candidatus Lokiarchaeota archaeon]|nr:competence damage-inducible protein A [Candidatus Lokiarchaeota archaeon]
MDVEILVIGNEVLIGKTQDTNSNWMAKRITKYGHRLRRITTIGDSLEEISHSIKDVLSRNPEMIITSGGMGPTFDDMTLEGIGIGLNKKLLLNDHAYNMIKKSYEQAHKQKILKLEGMTKERTKMAYLPEGSTPLPNIRGTAPGVKINAKNKTTIYILPGVPSEMKAMFSNSIKPILIENRGLFMEKGFIFEGIGESQIAPYVTKVEEKYPQLWIKTHPRVGLAVEVELSITAFNLENGEKLAEKALEELKTVILELKGKIKE